MKKILLLCLLLAGSSSLFATDYYWVGGTGDWSDINKWATTPGGTIKHSIAPSANDDVYFDANSGLVDGTVVYMPTTVHAYCRNMSWAGVTGKATFRNNGTYSLFVYGNMEFAASVAYGTRSITFSGSSNATVKINGAKRINAAGWYNPFFVEKAGGSLTLLDNIVIDLQVSTIRLYSGHLNLSGGNHIFWSLESVNNTTRSVDISNAIITTTVTWDLRGANKTLNATNSTINTEGSFGSDGGVYNNVLIHSTNVTSMITTATTFNELIFTSPASKAGTVRVGGGNTIGKLEFKGAGLIRFGNNTIDQLIVAPGKVLMLFENNTINGLLQLQTPGCSGIGEIIADEGYTATLTFGSSATVDVNNVHIKNVTATGAISLPIAVTGMDGGGATGWNITPPVTAGTTLYWVGGKGDWNDKNHWSATSGGGGGYCVPLNNDNVVFDDLSGFAAGDSVFTSSNVWCKNMTWTNVANAPVFEEHTSYTLTVYGSVILDPTVTYNAEFSFRGNAITDFTSNGNSLGKLHLTIQKDPAGGVSLVDNFSNPVTYIRLNAGQFLMPGRTLNIAFFASNLNANRTLDITNATITTTEGWSYYGSGNSQIGNAAGSFITSHGFFSAESNSYPKISLSTALDVVTIRNATIGELVFTNTSPTSQVRIHNNNNITSLEFKGAGKIVNGGNTIGSLLLAPNLNYYLAGVNTINTLLQFNSPSCSGLGELRGFNETLTTINFGSSATTNMSNVYLSNIAATGSITPITVSGADAGGNSGFIINSSAGSDRYWVGGSGDWNDNSHWSTTPGGAGGACIPTVNDNVYFTAASFTSGSNTVTTTGNAYAKNMDWTGAAFNPIFNESASFNMEVWGNLVMNPAVTMNTNISFLGSTNSTITVNGSDKGNFDFIINKPNAGVSLGMNDNLSNLQTNITVTRGAFNAAGRTLTVAALSDLGTANATAVDISNGTFNGSWGYTGTNKTLNAANSQINAAVFLANGGNYNNVTVSTGNNDNIIVANTNIPSLTFTNTAANALALIGANNIIGTLEFKAKGGFTGSNNTIGTLVFASGREYTFANGTSNTITTAWYGSGTPCNATTITSPSPGTATVTMNGPSVDLDYIILSGITAAGTAAPFNAYKHSTNMGRNTNWTIEPYAGSTPLEGLGPDLVVPSDQFPHRLNTDGFFGSPLSQYKWNDNSTLSYLDIPGPGTYSVEVSFPDGCKTTDQIVVQQTWPLPVTIVSFTAKAADCTPQLNWETTDAINFSRFDIERSTDGKNYIHIGSISFNEAIAKYSYADLKASQGKFYYRLKLVDIDGRYEYSRVAGVQNSCGKEMEVYPTITASDVQVVMPAGFENAVVKLFSAAGQELPVNGMRSANKRTIYLGNLPKGYYFVQVNNGIELKTVKVMKK